MQRLACITGALRPGRVWQRIRYAATRQRLDEPRILGRIGERFAQLPDGAVQADIEIDKRLGRPQSLPELLARDYVSGTPQQQTQNLE